MERYGESTEGMCNAMAGPAESMEGPSRLHGTPLDGLWRVHGGSMKGQWCLRACTLHGALWILHGTLHGAPWRTMVPSMDPRGV